MKKALILVSFFCCVQSAVNAQYAFSDADSISRHYMDGAKFKNDKPSLLVIASLLNKHLKDSFPPDDPGSVFIAYNKNPFIKSLIPSIGNSFSGANRMTSDDRSFLPVSGFNVPMIADGLAKFLVERFKEEMVYAFLDNFKKILLKYPEFEVMFPSTVAMLQQIESFKIKEILPALREKFKQDITTIYERIPKLLDTGVFATLLKGHDGYKQLLVEGSTITGHIVRGDHFSSVLHDFASYPQSTTEDSSLINVSATLRLIGTLSESFRTEQTGKVWMNADSILHRMENKFTLQIYLGLLYEHVKDVSVLIKDRKVVTLGELMNADPATMDKVKTTAIYMSQLLNDVDELAKEIKAHKNEPQTADNYVAYLDKSLAIVKNNYEVINVFCGDCIDTKKTNKVLDVFTNSIDLYHYIRQKKYILAITEFYLIVKDITELTTKVDRAQQNKASEVVDQLLKYGTFMAAVVEAESSDEVRDVIKASVLPPGSSITKTYSSFSISLGSYVGVATGHDFFNQLSSDAFNSAAIWAPVGLSLNFGTKIKCFGTVGVHLSIIDIGALVSFRWDDSTTTALPQLNARNLLAPGGYITLGRLFNTPLTLGFGGQYGPQLRSLTATNADISRDTWRLNITLSCDIPFFYIYRRPFRR